MHDKLNGLILLNAYSPTLETRQAKRLAEELTLRGVNVTVRRNDGFMLGINGGAVAGDARCDFCLYLDKDKYTAQMLEKRGVRLFNRAQAIADCDDKMQTHIALADNGIPMPKTLAGLLCYDRNASVPTRVLDDLEKSLGYPLVVKLSYGSFGKGVFKADDRAQLAALAESVKLHPHLFQQYVAAAHGKDMRVIVVGGKTLGGILRTSNGDFRSNVGLGGTAKKTDVPAEISALSRKIARLLNLDYCGLDFLLSPAPLLCEVNSNAFFDAFESATGINVAGAYAEHIVSTMRGANQTN